MPSYTRGSQVLTISRYLEEDQSTTVLERRRKLEGYECYLVEQWACSRTHPTFVITTYTGDPSHSVIASVLSVPTDEGAWSPRLKVYFKALDEYHARRRETPLGTLMITNLSGFPSSLTVIPVPEGDVRKHREDFFVNENLKRLACSGRVGLTLAKPSGATEAKFHQLYRTSDKIPLYASVIELVKLCQVALMLFGVLRSVYVDGLLCDMTEKAVNDWWLEFGNDYYNTEPHDGILGPTTVAGLLGMLMGARNRLHAYGAPVAKDVFDVESTKRGIAYFQKSQRVQKSRRLDRQTLEKLHRTTAKAANGEGWTVPRAVKSTVVELSGKGGEMVLDTLGVRDKARIADVETVDVERFIQLVQGERAKWLWYGKSRKRTSGNMFNRLPGEEAIVFEEDDHGGYAWTGGRRDTAFPGSTPHPLENASHIEEHALNRQGGSADSHHMHKMPTFRRAAGKMNDARTGLGRIKDAVGRRGHHSKHSKHENDVTFAISNQSEPILRRRSSAPASPTSPQTADESFDKTDKLRDEKRVSPGSADRTDHAPTFTRTLTEAPLELRSTLFSESGMVSRRDEQPELDALLHSDLELEDGDPTARTSIGGSVYRGVDLDELFAAEDEADFNVGPLLRRTQSTAQCIARLHETRDDNWWPRHLSFSVAEDSLLTWDTSDWTAKEEPDAVTDPKKELTKELLAAESARRLCEQMSQLATHIGDWVNWKLNDIEELNKIAEVDQQELDGLYHARHEEYEALHDDSKGILAQERAQLQDAVKDVEVLGAKLEYEINALRSKVEDVEDGVAEFERQVVFIEERAKELDDESRRRNGWLSKTWRALLGSRDLSVTG